MAYLFGIDISNWQGLIDWDLALADGVEFAMIKSSEGTDYVDPWLARNWSECARLGIPKAAYHFLRADVNPDPTGEVDHLLSVLGPLLAPGDGIALDVEDYPGSPQPANLYGTVLAFTELVHARLGFWPFIYSTSGYLSAHNCTGKPDLARCGLWLASWYNNPPETFPAPPPAWAFTAVWQYTDHGIVGGINGGVDCNRFNGTAEQFRAYGLPGGPTQAPPRGPLDVLYAAQAGCRNFYTTPADTDNLDQVVQQIDYIKTRYNFDP